MTKSLIIINESFGEMLLGRNTTLSYVASCAELNHEIFIFNLAETAEILEAATLTNLKVLKLEKSDALFLAQKFREENKKISDLRKLRKFDELAILENPRISDILPANFQSNYSLKITEIDFVLQRLEPMKSPFPPEGKAQVKSAMKWLKSLFPNKIFNCPITPDFIELEDKETPQQINQIYHQELATPTAEFCLGNEETSDAITFAIEKYQQIFNSDSAAKIVIKPKNSAQSLGVFALQFSNRGFDLETIKSKKVRELSNVQIYKIQPQNLSVIITILCFVQRVKDDQNYDEKLIGNISDAELFSKAKELYNHKILAQPFLEGISEGDIRANILKDSRGDFYCAGYTFRSSNRDTIDDDFTTCYTAGKAISKPISFLSDAEKTSLIAHCEVVLKILNHELRQKYQNIVELGADFILVGDKRSVMLGEVNHHCPALIPISEAMSENHYDEGLGLTKKAVSDILLLQNKQKV